MKYKMVHVDWIDSHGANGWGQKVDEDFDLSCQTVGFLLKKSKDRISIAQSTSNQGSIADVIQIPMIAVKKIKYLR